MEKCDICYKRFSSQLNLRKHIENIQKKMKFKCEICGKEFSQKDNLLNHKRYIHSKSIEFKCTVREKNLVEKKTCWHIKMCCKYRHCHEQFPSPSELLNYICPEKTPLSPLQNELSPMNQLFIRL